MKGVAVAIAEMEHRARDPNVCRADAGNRALKILRGNSDNRELSAVERDCLAENLRIVAKAPLPQTVADHRDGTRARDLVFLGIEKTPERRRELQHAEIVAGDHAAIDQLRFAGDDKVDWRCWILRR